MMADVTTPEVIPGRSLSFNELDDFTRILVGTISELEVSIEHL